MCSIQHPCLLLIVEDDYALIRLLWSDSAHRLFVDNGLKADIVSTIADAGKRLAEISFDVILLDLGLPDSEGAETVKKVREMTSAPIFAFSGTVDSSLKGLCVEYGAKDFFLKNAVDLPDLAGVLKTAAANYRKSQEIERRFDAILGQ